MPSAVKQVGRQADDALEDAGAHQLLADDRLGIAAEQHAVGQDAGGLAVGLHAADDVQQIGVVALFGGRHAPAEALVKVIFRSKAGAPGFVRERWIGNHVVIGAKLFAILELGRG